MPDFPSPADELRHLEEKQLTVGLSDEEQARLAELSGPAASDGGFDVAAAAAGVLAEPVPGGGPWTAADYGWDPADENAVAWAAYYSELGWDPATVQAHLEAEAAAAAPQPEVEADTQPEVPAQMSDAPGGFPVDSAPAADASPLDAAAPGADLPWAAGEPTAALEPLAPEAPVTAADPAALLEELPAVQLEVLEPEPEMASIEGAAAWDAPAPAASFAPEGEDVPAPAPIADAGATQVWDLSAVQSAIAGGALPAAETGAGSVELLPTFDAGAGPAAPLEPPDFRHDVPPGWPGEPEAALRADFELAGSGSFDPASSAALPGMDAVPPSLPELVPEAPAPAAAPSLAVAPDPSSDAPLDDFDIELDGGDLEAFGAPPEPEPAVAVVVATADEGDRLSALDLSAPFLGEPESEPELAAAAAGSAADVDWAAAHAVPAGDPAVDLATFDALPETGPADDTLAGDLPAPDDATELWALGEPVAPAPAARSSAFLAALEDEPEPAPPEPEPAALASAADFLAAAAAAAPALPPAAELAEPEILEVGDDVLEVVPEVAVVADEAPAPPAPAPAPLAPAAAAPVGLEALFYDDAFHEAPPFPDLGAIAAFAPAGTPTAPEPAALEFEPAAELAIAAPEPPPPPPPAARVASLARPAPEAAEPDDWPLGLAAEEPAAEPAPPAPSPVFVSGVHRVVVHTAEGQVKRGTLTDVALDAPQVLLAPQAGGELEPLPAERIRAIFFMLPAGETPPQPEGKKVRVTFRDGRQVAGFSPDYDPERVGFFMIPADTRTHTARIWVYRASVRQVSVS